MKVVLQRNEEHRITICSILLGIGDEKSAKDSADLFLFISKYEKKILDVVVK